MTTPIYLDYNATTPIDPAVVDAMEPYLRDHFGNPSSDHAYGYRTRAAVQTARAQLAALLGAAPAEVVFTGGGSEANNLAIKGVAYALGARGNHLITSAVEHPAVAEPLRFLERQGYQVTTLPVDHDGRVDPDAGRRGHHRADDPGVDHARQQRGRQLSSRSARSRTSRTRVACLSIPTPPKPSAKSRCAYRILAWIC